MAAVTAQSKQRSKLSRSQVAARALRLFALTLTFVLASAATALAIPREATLARGLSWINQHVPYSQTRYYAGYRTDCSGFVSMCWALPSSYNTRTLYRVAYPITAADLQPGDALLRAGYHVRLFVSWADAAQTRYVAYEETGPGAVQTVKSIDSDLQAGYIPYRYNGIGGLAPTWNALKNPSLHWWSASDATWWTASRDSSGTVSRRTPDVVSSPLASLGIVNRSTDPRNVVQVSQTGPIEASKTYTLDGFAWTNRNPSAVRVRLQMFDSSGRSLVDTSTTGDRLGLTSGPMRRMSMVQPAPPGGVSATVSFMLYGGSYLATGTPGSAVFDDVTLYVTSPAPVYRLYNTATGTHFYTSSGPERDSVIEWLWGAYQYEGVAYAVKDTPANSQLLYRFYNVRNGTHFYTASDAERDSVMATLGWLYRYEGPAYKVSPAPVAGATTVYRFYNVRNGTHFYTASDAERDGVIGRLGWLYRYEGPAFFLAP